MPTPLGEWNFILHTVWALSWCYLFRSIIVFGKENRVNVPGSNQGQLCSPGNASCNPERPKDWEHDFSGSTSNWQLKCLMCSILSPIHGPQSQVIHFRALGNDEQGIRGPPFLWPCVIYLSFCCHKNTMAKVNLQKSLFGLTALED